MDTDQNKQTTTPISLLKIQTLSLTSNCTTVASISNEYSFSNVPSYPNYRAENFYENKTPNPDEINNFYNHWRYPFLFPWGKNPYIYRNHYYDPYHNYGNKYFDEHPSPSFNAELPPNHMDPLVSNYFSANYVSTYEFPKSEAPLELNPAQCKDIFYSDFKPLLDPTNHFDLKLFETPYHQLNSMLDNGSDQIKIAEYNGTINTFKKPQNLENDNIAITKYQLKHETAQPETKIMSIPTDPINKSYDIHHSSICSLKFCSSSTFFISSSAASISPSSGFLNSSSSCIAFLPSSLCSNNMIASPITSSICCNFNLPGLYDASNSPTDAFTFCKSTTHENNSATKAKTFSSNNQNCLPTTEPCPERTVAELESAGRSCMNAKMFDHVKCTLPAGIVHPSATMTTQQNVLSGGSSELLSKMYDTALEKYEHMKRDYDMLRNKFTDLSGSYDNTLLRVERESLKIRAKLDAALDERTHLLRENFGLKQHVSYVSRRVEMLEMESKDKSEQTRRISLQRDEAIKEMNHALALQIKGSKDLEKRLVERNAAVHEYNLVMAERDTVHREIDKLNEELVEAKLNLNNLLKEREDLVKEKEASRDRETELTRERETADTELKTLKHELREVRNENETLSKSIELSGAENLRLVQERDHLRQDKILALEDRDNLFKEYYKKDKSSYSDKEALYERLWTIQSEFLDAKKELEGLRGQMNSFRKRHEQILCENDRYKQLCIKLKILIDSFLEKFGIDSLFDSPCFGHYKKVLELFYTHFDDGIEDQFTLYRKVDNLQLEILEVCYSLNVDVPIDSIGLSFHKDDKKCKTLLNNLLGMKVKTISETSIFRNNICEDDVIYAVNDLMMFNYNGKRFDSLLQRLLKFGDGKFRLILMRVLREGDTLNDYNIPPYKYIYTRLVLDEKLSKLGLITKEYHNDSNNISTNAPKDTLLFKFKTIGAYPMRKTGLYSTTNNNNNKKVLSSPKTHFLNSSFPKRRRNPLPNYWTSQPRGMKGDFTGMKNQSSTNCHRRSCLNYAFNDHRNFTIFKDPFTNEKEYYVRNPLKSANAKKSKIMSCRLSEGSEIMESSFNQDNRSHLPCTTNTTYTKKRGKLTLKFEAYLDKFHEKIVKKLTASHGKSCNKRYSHELLNESFNSSFNSQKGALEAMSNQTKRGQTIPMITNEKSCGKSKSKFFRSKFSKINLSPTERATLAAFDDIIGSYGKESTKCRGRTSSSNEYLEDAFSMNAMDTSTTSSHNTTNLIVDNDESAIDDEIIDNPHQNHSFDTKNLLDVNVCQTTPELIDSTKNTIIKSNIQTDNFSIVNPRQPNSCVFDKFVADHSDKSYGRYNNNNNTFHGRSYGIGRKGCFYKTRSSFNGTIQCTTNVSPELDRNHAKIHNGDNSILPNENFLINSANKFEGSNNGRHYSTVKYLVSHYQQHQGGLNNNEYRKQTKGDTSGIQNDTWWPKKKSRERSSLFTTIFPSHKTNGKSVEISKVDTLGSSFPEKYHSNVRPGVQLISSIKPDSKGKTRDDDHIIKSSTPFMATLIKKRNKRGTPNRLLNEINSTKHYRHSGYYGGSIKPKTSSKILEDRFFVNVGSLDRLQSNKSCLNVATNNTFSCEGENLNGGYANYIDYSMARNYENTTNHFKKAASNVEYSSLLNKVRSITIDKSTEPLGIKIVCITNNSNDVFAVENYDSEDMYKGGIYVSSVEENSLAFLAGLQIGDQLLEICGINIRNATYSLAANVLRNCGQHMTILAQYNPTKYFSAMLSKNSSDKPALIDASFIPTIPHGKEGIGSLLIDQNITKGCSTTEESDFDRKESIKHFRFTNPSPSSSPNYFNTLKISKRSEKNEAQFLALTNHTSRDQLLHSGPVDISVSLNLSQTSNGGKDIEKIEINNPNMNLFQDAQPGDNLGVAHIYETMYLRYLNLNISLVGGNKEGIFIQDNTLYNISTQSPILNNNNNNNNIFKFNQSSSINKTGYQIMDINEKSVKSLTLEEAIISIGKSMRPTITFTATENKNKFEGIQYKTGDSFYVKALMDKQFLIEKMKDFNLGNVIDLSDCLHFKKHQILLIDETIANAGKMWGFWRAWTLDQRGKKIECGLIPSLYKLLFMKPFNCTVKPSTPATGMTKNLTFLNFNLSDGKGDKAGSDDTWFLDDYQQTSTSNQENNLLMTSSLMITPPTSFWDHKSFNLNDSDQSPYADNGRCLKHQASKSFTVGRARTRIATNIQKLFAPNKSFHLKQLKTHESLEPLPTTSVKTSNDFNKISIPTYRNLENVYYQKMRKIEICYARPIVLFGSLTHEFTDKLVETWSHKFQKLDFDMMKGSGKMMEQGLKEKIFFTYRKINNHFEYISNEDIRGLLNQRNFHYILDLDGDNLLGLKSIFNIYPIVITLDFDHATKDLKEFVDKNRNNNNMCQSSKECNKHYKHLDLSKCDQQLKECIIGYKIYGTSTFDTIFEDILHLVEGEQLKALWEPINNIPHNLFPINEPRSTL